MFYILKLNKKLRVSREMEFQGLDLVKHGEAAYPAEAWREVQYGDDGELGQSLPPNMISRSSNPKTKLEEKEYYEMKPANKKEMSPTENKMIGSWSKVNKNLKKQMLNLEDYKDSEVILTVRPIGFRKLSSETRLVSETDTESTVSYVEEKKQDIGGFTNNAFEDDDNNDSIDFAKLPLENKGNSFKDQTDCQEDECVSGFTAMGYSLGKDDLKVVPLLKSLGAELVGTMFLVIIGCGAAMQWKTEFDTTQVSLAFGLAVMAIASFTGHLSGGNLNPAVSVGLLAGGQLSLLKCVLYIIAQCIGAVIGAAILLGVTPEGVPGRIALGSNGLSPNVTPLGGLVMELLMTMLLVLVVYASAVDAGNQTSPMVAPLLIGLTVSAAHLVLMPYTGTSINPARSLGPALVSGNTGDLWVFWVGPLLGGALGGVLYRFGMMNTQED